MSRTTRSATTSDAIAPADSGDWRDDAECRTADPDLFFPIGTTALAVRQTREAKQVCARCEVRPACLQWAVATGQTSGVWGGLSEDERRELTGDRSGQYARCIDAQEFIERRIADGAKYRHIADELNVGHHAICRAVKFFHAERAGVAA